MLGGRLRRYPQVSIQSHAQQCIETYTKAFTAGTSISFEGRRKTEGKSHTVIMTSKKRQILIVLPVITMGGDCQRSQCAIKMTAQ
jgi:hypothetical protein